MNFIIWVKDTTYMPFSLSPAFISLSTFQNYKPITNTTTIIFPIE